jgi:hypothetical protein
VAYRPFSSVYQLCTPVLAQCEVKTSQSSMKVSVSTPSLSTICLESQRRPGRCVLLAEESGRRPPKYVEDLHSIRISSALRPFTSV